MAKTNEIKVQGMKNITIIITEIITIIITEIITIIRKTIIIMMIIITIIRPLILIKRNKRGAGFKWDEFTMRSVRVADTALI
jgi:hypothetical protein